MALKTRNPLAKAKSPKKKGPAGSREKGAIKDTLQTMSKKRGNVIAKSHLKLREALWPDIDEKLLFKGDKDNPGFAIIPRTMPIILKIMDEMSVGKPVSSTYLELWCRALNHSFVELNKPSEMAFHAGFGGQRATQTWISRLKILEELKFIETKSGSSGPHSYAIIWNPSLVIIEHSKVKTPGFQTALFNELKVRAIKLGVKEFESI